MSESTPKSTPQTSMIGLIEGTDEGNAGILKLFSAWLSDKLWVASG